MMGKKTESRAIRDAYIAQLTLDADGPGSPGEILARLQESRNRLKKGAGRFMLLSMLFSVLYLAYTAKFQAQAAFFDQKILELPYGSLVFCVGSQVLLCLGIARFLDGRAVDRIIKAVCEAHWKSRYKPIYLTYPDEEDIITPALEIAEIMGDARLASRAIMAAMVPSSLIITVSWLAPVIEGVHFLVSWKQTITSGWVPLQFYGVVPTTFVTSLWVVAVCLIFAMDD